MKIRHGKAITLSGVLWVLIGLWLLFLGLGFIGEVLQMLLQGKEVSAPLMKSLASLLKGVDRAAVVLVATSLFLGHLKCRLILSKTVMRMVLRVRSLPNPVAFQHVYGKRYLILILIMVGLGMSMRVLGVPLDIRGGVDAAIGSALLNGSFLFFKEALALSRCKQAS